MRGKLAHILIRACHLKPSKFLFATLFFALPLASFAKADTAGVSFAAPGSPMNNGNGYSLGYSFTANTNLNVTALGYFDDGGLRETHAVGLYDSNGQLLASTTVDGKGTQQGYFSFDSISPVTLTAGKTYEVMGNSGLIDGYSFDTLGFTVDPRITFLNDEYAQGNTLQFGNGSENILAADGGAFFGGNFLSTSATVTPEPSSMLLLTTGATALAGAARRRLRA